MPEAGFFPTRSSRCWGWDRWAWSLAAAKARARERMVAGAAEKALRYQERRVALAPSRGVRFVHVPEGSEPPPDAFAVKRVSFIRHGQGDHNLHGELWEAAGKAEDLPEAMGGSRKLHDSLDMRKTRFAL